MAEKIQKVIFVTPDVPFYIPKYLKNVLDKIGENQKVKKVYAVPFNLPKKNFFQTVKYYFTFYGFVVFSYLVILRIYYLISDFLNWFLKTNDCFHSVKLVCRKYRIPFSKIKNINSKDVIKEIKTINPDIILSLTAPQKFKESLISIPLKGCLNIHSALLPKYRGWNANFWVLAKGEKVTGVTIHYMNKEIDCGDILLQKQLEIKNEWSLHDLYINTINLGSSMISEVLKMTSEGKVLIQKNDISAGSHYTVPNRQDIKEFRSRKRKFFKFY